MSTTLQDLQSAAGVAITAGGTLLPMRDVIRLASQSNHYLVIYDKHTREPLYCGRSKRFATPGQRIVLHALDRGCTRSSAIAGDRVIVRGRACASAARTHRICSGIHLPTT